ncbi:MAG: tetratricopeptide repeat protein [Bacteroidota bacterium]
MILRYLDGELSEEERLEVESQLHLSSVREYLDTYRNIAEVARQQGEKKTWQDVQELEAKAVRAESQSPSSTKWLLRGMAASLLLLMVAFPIYWFQDEQRNGRLFDQHYQAYQPLGGATRGESDADLLLPQAFEAYYEQDYDQAIELFTKASTQEDRPYVWLYLGNAYLSDEQPQKALEALQRVLTYPDINRKTELRAHWDLGLAYLKLNNEDSAARHFELLQNTEDYGGKAKKILQSIY